MNRVVLVLALLAGASLLSAQSNGESADAAAGEEPATAGERAAAAAVSAERAAEDASWYRSNAEGEQLAEIVRSARANHRYVVAVSETESGREVTLYSEGRPMEHRVLGADGEQQYTERYSYYADGRLQEVSRRYPDGRIVRSRYEFIRGELTAEWHETGTETRLVRYDDRGRVESEQRWSGEQLVDTLRYEYDGPQDRRPNRSITVHHNGGNGSASEAGSSAGGSADDETADGAEDRTVRLYDEEGRIVERRRVEEGDVVSVLEQEWGEHGVVREHVEDRSGSRTTEWEYGEEGEILVRTEYADERITELVRFEEENRRVREIYRNGELALRVYLRGEQRLREEVIRNGRVVEERNFDADES